MRRNKAKSVDMMEEEIKMIKKYLGNS